MNDNLDDWLNSLGIEPTPTQPARIQQPSQPSEQLHFHMPNGEVIDVPIIHEENSSDEPEEVEPQPEPISPSDTELEEILSNNGFGEPLQEPEEIHEGSDDEGVVAQRQSADDYEISEQATEAMSRLRETIDEILQSSGDANWQEAVDSGGIVPVAEEFEEAPLPVESNDSSNEPLLPPNSPTLLMDDSTSRFSGMEWFNEIQSKKITIAGMGGIGSWCALQIGRMKPSALYLYDDDNVETANMSGQFYRRSDVGKRKVDAVANILGDYTSTYSVFSFARRYSNAERSTDIMICGFDNMAARKTFFYSWRIHLEELPEDMRKECLFIDGRLSVDTLQVFCITGDDTYNLNRYSQEFLFSDEEADETVCSMKQTTYLACMIGSIMTNLFVNFCANLCGPAIPYDLPFFTEYDAQNMIFKTEN